MTTQPDGLELFTVNVTERKLQAGESIFVFTSGSLRGKLISVRTVTAVPAATYGGTYTKPPEPCVQIEYIPGPRNSGRVKELTTFNFSRQPTVFNIPVRAINGGFFLRKLEDGVWMLNVVTSFKGDAG